MRHCSTRELDLWRVTLGRSETGEASSQAPLGGELSANWIKVEVQCSSVLWNSSQGCLPSPGLLGSPPLPLTPTPVWGLDLRVLQRIFTGCLHLSLCCDQPGGGTSF